MAKKEKWSSYDKCSRAIMTFARHNFAKLMKKIIHNLRNQPEDVRRHILHITTVVLAIFLFLIWVYSLGSGFSSEDLQEQVKTDIEPLSALKDNFINGYNSIQKDPLSELE